MISAASKPQLMVGVPSGYLSNRLPFPPNVEYNVPVGVEIAPGLGISLDGKTLLVGPDGHQGRTDIVGHLKDGLYPQRDTVVLRGGEETTVDGYYNWQDFKVKGQPGEFTAENENPVRGFSVTSTDNGFRVENPKAARAWTIEANEGGFSVRSDYEGGETFQISRNGNTTLVDSNLAEQDFTVTQQSNGAAVIDGHYKFDDFTWNPTAKGYDLQGHFEHQHFAITQS